MLQVQPTPYALRHHATGNDTRETIVLHAIHFRRLEQEAQLMLTNPRDAFSHRGQVPWAL